MNELNSELEASRKPHKTDRIAMRSNRRPECYYVEQTMYNHRRATYEGENASSERLLLKCIFHRAASWKEVADFVCNE